MTHVFKRENIKNLTEQCQICDGRWRPGGEGIAAFIRCKECGLMVHSSCRSVAEKCGIRCGEVLAFSDHDRTDYSVQVTIVQVADIGISDQSYVYAVIKSGSKSLYRSPLAVVDHQGVSWTNHLASLTLPLSDLSGSLMVEIWSSFFDIMDQHQYSAVIDLQPLTRFKTISIDRWFPADAVASSIDQKALQTRIFLGFSLIANPPPPQTVVLEETVNSLLVEPNFTNTPHAVNEEVEIAAVVANEVTTAAVVAAAIGTTSSYIPTWTNNLLTSTSLSINQTWNRVGNLLYDFESKEFTGTKSRSNSLTSADLNPLPQPDPIGTINVAVSNLKFASDLAATVAAVRVSLLDSSVKKSMTNTTNSTILHETTTSPKTWISAASTSASTTVLQIDVAHYRTPVIVEVAVDNGRVLGQGKIFAYQIMQQQADLLFASHGAPAPTLITIHDTNNKIVAYLECEVTFKEDLNTFFWSSLVKSLPASAEEEVSIDRLGTHVARFRAMINCFTNFYRDYLYLMEWKDPMLTSSMFLLFLYCTLYIQPRYSLSGALFFLIIIMTKGLLKRRSQDFKTKFLHPFMPALPLPYMPVVTLKMAVLGYKPASTLLQKTTQQSLFGLSTSSTSSSESRLLSAIKVSYIPDKSHFASSEAKRASSLREINVGVIACSSGASTTSDNSKAYLTSLLSHFISSDHIKSSDALLFNIFDPWSLSKEALRLLKEESGMLILGTAELSLLYPIALNIRSANTNSSNSGGSEGRMVGLKGTNKEMHYSPPQQQGNATALAHQDADKTSSSPNQTHRRSPDFLLPETQHSSHYKQVNVDVNGKLKLTLLHNHEGTTSFLDTSIQETLFVNLQDVLQYGEKVDKEGLEYEYIAILQAQESSSTSTSVAVAAEEEVLFEGGFLTPQKAKSKPVQAIATNSRSEVLVRIQLTFPSFKHVYKPSKTQQLLSRVLQELQLDRGDKESSTFSVLWNVRDHVKHAQNLMAWILDYFESGKNLFNWTLPYRTLPFYFTLVLIWLLTVFISSQHLVLVWGLYQFLYVILPIPEGNEITIRFLNLLQSIPNDDDLMEIYAEERKKFNDQRAQLLKIETTEVLLKSCLSVQWTGSVLLRCHRSTGEVSDMEWMSVYMVLQGHRLVWWMNEEDVGKGTAHMEQLILSQVAGLTQVSPVDSRRFAGVGYLLSLFGEDQTAKPLKVSLHFEQVHPYEEFRKKIESLLDTSDK